MSAGMYTTQAPAKINLDLRILATRADGYHELVTVFQSLALADVLTLMPWDGPFRLTCSTPGVPLDAANLAWQGAVAVATSARRGLDGWHLHLDKRVPAEAGLGGGSADAVAAARLMLAAWGESWDRGRLIDVLAAVGSDVPYFVTGGTVRGRGRGERLEPLPDVPRMTAVVVRPDFGIATRDAYRWYDTSGTSPVGGEPGAPPCDGAHWPDAWATCRNDLQPPVEARHPRIADMVYRLRQSGATLAMMSGSGSAVFGLFADDHSAAKAANGWSERDDVWLSHTLGTDQYAKAVTVERYRPGAGIERGNRRRPPPDLS